MFLAHTVQRFQQIWRGPALAIVVNGQRHRVGRGEPAAEVVIHKPAILPRLWLSPSLTFGDAYMRGDIEVRGPLMPVLHGFYLTAPALAARWPGRALAWWRRGWSRVPRRQAIANAEHHYDIGNAFYRLWLDESMTYSCACFLRETDDLATAQWQKLELLCRKARLRPGQRLLDIGCGWGSLLLHAARHHDVHVTGVTPAAEQAGYIRDEARRLGLGEQVRVICGDWRDVTGRYDRIISVGMFEHVGVKQYRAFLDRWRALLVEGGLSVLHTIGRMAPQPPDPWIRRHIFPGGYLPTLAQLASHAGAAGLDVLDVENLRRHYSLTLRGWSENFDRVREQVGQSHGQRFARMWWLYLQGAEAAFRWGGLHLWQLVLARDADAPWPLDREVRLAEATRELSNRATDEPAPVV